MIKKNTLVFGPLKKLLFLFAASLTLYEKTYNARTMVGVHILNQGPGPTIWNERVNFKKDKLSIREKTLTNKERERQTSRQSEKKQISLQKNDRQRN